MTQDAMRLALLEESPSTRRPTRYMSNFGSLVMSATECNLLPEFEHTGVVRAGTRCDPLRSAGQVERRSSAMSLLSTTHRRELDYIVFAARVCCGPVRAVPADSRGQESRRRVGDRLRGLGHQSVSRVGPTSRRPRSLSAILSAHAMPSTWSGRRFQGLG